MSTTTPKKSEFQFRLRALFVLVTVAAIVLALMGWLRDRMLAVGSALVGKTGPVTSHSDWPQPLRELLEEPNGSEVDASSIQVHCLCQGFDPEFVWRMEATPGLLDHLRQRWQLTQVATPNLTVLQGRSRISGVAAPAWWSPKVDSNTIFFANPNELQKEKSDRLQVAFDRKRNTIFVWYWFNF